ncbi:Ubiquinone biosynthesis O-methyltransferase, mitochondrial [Paraconexibacter sp. AEG42_29]|uniref:Ubiquinone biosynthesis O-methyltransferase, mitochondrial n=1 Tax=Paraconexibacter sp. AEG42_29 TaxID=2997339 RepID=A0AAU7B1Y5_9ACTN
MGVDERLSLDAVSEHTLIAAEHRHRYELAAAAAPGKRVLDLCCGAGYGSAMLADAGGTVTGVDRDAAAVDTAQASIGNGRDVTFVAADALEYLRSVAPGTFDLVVCFEGLEHLPDVGLVVAELHRLVIGGAAMMASVPNSATFGEDNEFHLTDFDLESTRALFGAFDDLTLAYQTHAEGSLIRGAAAAPVTATVHETGEQDLDWANHFLVLAGGLDADALLDDASLHLAVGPVNHRYMRGLERANAALLATNGRLSRERLGLGAAGGASAALRREDEVASLHAAVVAAGAREQQLRDELAALEAEAVDARAERDGYRRAHMAVHSSRLTNLAARLAGHRFPRS